MNNFENIFVVLNIISELTLNLSTLKYNQNYVSIMTISIHVEFS